MRKEFSKSLVISFLAVLMSMPVSAYDFECDGIYYDLLEDPYGEHHGLIEDHTLAVVSGDSEYKGDIVIPSEVTIDGTTYRVTAIGHVGQVHPYVFRNCSELTSVTIPKSVSVIGNAFMNCSALASLKVESGNQRYDSRDNCNAIIETSTNMLIAGCKNTTIPDGVTKIADIAFLGCTDLTSITIPSSVTTIGFQAFRSCTGLTSVTIPGGVLVRDYAFKDCSGLTSVSIQGILTRIGHEVFADCTALNSVTIDQGVIELGSNVFNNCTSLTTVSIPNSVYALGGGAFRGCTGLTSVTIGDGVTGIDSDTFNGCTSLTSVSIPKNVTIISRSAFQDCTALTSITIPSRVTTIGWWVFSGCSNLRTIVSEIEYPFALESRCISSDIYTNVELVVPVGTKSRYERTSGWKEFTKISEGTTDIDGIPTTTAAPEVYYSLDGRRLKSPQKGINIICQSDGTTKKVIVK